LATGCSRPRVGATKALRRRAQGPAGEHAGLYRWRSGSRGTTETRLVLYTWYSVKAMTLCRTGRVSHGRLLNVLTSRKKTRARLVKLHPGKRCSRGAEMKQSRINDRANLS
jgi:hypothetical protein